MIRIDKSFWANINVFFIMPELPVKIHRLVEITPASVPFEHISLSFCYCNISAKIMHANYVKVREAIDLTVETA